MNKFNDHGIYPLHLDAMPDNHQELVKKYLMLFRSLSEYKERTNVTLVLFASPRLLLKESMWNRSLRVINNHGLLSVICIDEVHTFVTDVIRYGGIRRRYLFKPLLAVISNLNILAMTGTATHPMIRTLEKNIHLNFASIMWGDMSRRHIFIDVIVPTFTKEQMLISIIIKRHLNKHNKCIVFTNIRDEAITKLLQLEGKQSVEMKAEGEVATYAVMDVSTLHGYTSIIMKNFLITAYQEKYNKLESDTAEFVFNLMVLIVTKAADCGIFSSTAATLGLYYGLPSNMTYLSQQLGRCGGCKRKPEDLYDEFVIILTLKSFILVVYCIHSEQKTESDKKEELTQYKSLVEVLIFFLWQTNAIILCWNNILVVTR